MPLQPAASKYLHFSIRTPLCQVSLWPLNSTSTSMVSSGPTSHAKTFLVILAFSSALHCRHPGALRQLQHAVYKCRLCVTHVQHPAAGPQQEDVAMLRVCHTGAAAGR